MRYHEVTEGEWVKPKMKYYYMKRGDCGLVHKMEFKLVKDCINRAKIIFRAWRVSNGM